MRVPRRVKFRRRTTIAWLMTASTTVVGAGVLPAFGDSAASAPAPTALTAGFATQPTGTLAAKPVTVPGQHELVLFLAADGPQTSRQFVSSVTGCNLTWSLIRRANAASGTSEAWRATTAPAGVTGCAPVARLASGGFTGMAALVGFAGARVSGAITDSGTTGAARISQVLSPTTVAYAVGNDWDTATARVVLPGQTKVAELLSPVGDTMWLQRSDRITTTGSAVVGTSSPIRDQWNLVSVAITSTSTASLPPATASTAVPSTTVASQPSTTTVAPKPTMTTVPPAPSTTVAPQPTTTTTTTPAPAPSTPPAVLPTVPAPSQNTPLSSAYPDGSNTGVPAGVILSPSGGLTITEPNTVVDAKDITGGVVVQAPGVVIKRSRIHGSGSYGVQVLSGNVRIEDSEIYGFENGIAFDNWTAVRVDVHGVSDDGVKLGDNVLLQDSWIHGMTPSAGAHADGGQMQSGVVNLTIRHNRIDVGSAANAALFMAPDLGPSTAGPVVVDNNILGGGNYILFCVDGNNGQYLVKNMSFTNNKFLPVTGYGAVRVNVPVTWSNNTWLSSGLPLSL